MRIYCGILCCQKGVWSQCWELGTYFGFCFICSWGTHRWRRFLCRGTTQQRAWKVWGKLNAESFIQWCSEGNPIMCFVGMPQIRRSSVLADNVTRGEGGSVNAVTEVSQSSNENMRLKSCQFGPFYKAAVVSKNQNGIKKTYRGMKEHVIYPEPRTTLWWE